MTCGSSLADLGRLADPSDADDAEGNGTATLRRVRSRGTLSLGAYFKVAWGDRRIVG